jgi:hypothetical protein
MNKEMQSIIRNLQNTISGEPWYGKPISVLMAEVDSSKASVRPYNKGHSLNDILYHMIFWSEYTIHCVNLNSPVGGFEKLDWPALVPTEDSWQNGISEFKNIHQKLIELLQTKEDEFLKVMIPGTNYNFRFLLNGLIQHNIYHGGQIAYLTKILE